MKNAIELSHQQMRNVIGGSGDEKGSRGQDSTRHCLIDGELIFETICTSDLQCQNIYGPKAKCY
jgi:hypothetical protein